MLLVANVVSLLGIPLVTISNNPVVLGALLFILDVGWASAFIFSNNLRDCITPNELLGRASSLDGAVFGLGTLYSMGAVALMLDHLRLLQRCACRQYPGCTLPHLHAGPL